MAFLEVGSVGSSLLRIITGEKKRTDPLFTRDEPRAARTADAVSTPIRTAPLNIQESEEQDALRSLRTAIQPK